MTHDLIWAIVRIVAVTYACYKLRQGVAHLRVIRKHMTKKPPQIVVSKAQADGFRQATGRDIQDAAE